MRKAFLLAILLAIAVSFWLYPFREKATRAGRALPDDVRIPYPAEYNFRQTKNDCAPFSTAAMLRVLEGKPVPTEKVIAAMRFRWQHGPAHPWVVEDVFRQEALDTVAYDASALVAADKTSFLRELLSSGKPVMILGGQSIMTQHYLVLLGYSAERDVFHVYNPAYRAGEEGMTQDANGNEPGNADIASPDLIKFWDGGGVLGFYRGYALVADRAERE